MVVRAVERLEADDGPRVIEVAIPQRLREAAKKMSNRREGGATRQRSIMRATSRWLHHTANSRVSTGRSWARTRPMRTQIIESPCRSA
jgi:hypothetical protein